jgi:hypothetical protein
MTVLLGLRLVQFRTRPSPDAGHDVQKRGIVGRASRGGIHSEWKMKLHRGEALKISCDFQVFCPPGSWVLVCGGWWVIREGSSLDGGGGCKEGGLEREMRP